MIRLKNQSFRSFHHSDSKKKMFNKIDLFPYSKSSFSVATGMISSTKVSIENFSSAEEASNNKTFILIHASESWQSENSKKCYLDSIHSIFKLVFFSHYKFQLLHKNLNLKFNPCRGVLKWETTDFVRCISILTVRNLQNKHLSILLGSQTHPHISPTTTGFSLSIEVSIKSFLVVETISKEILSILFLALEY